MGLVRLAYTSRRSSSLTDEALLRELIVPANNRNHKEGITGCLWCGDEMFIQVLEGEAEKVAALMARILKDPRHSKVRLLSNRTTSVRLFDNGGLKWVRARDCRNVAELVGVTPAVELVLAGHEDGVRRNEKGSSPEVAVIPGAGAFTLRETPGASTPIINALIAAEPTLY